MPILPESNKAYPDPNRSATRSATQLVVIPSYNSGPALRMSVRAARAAWAPVWVVIDGSTDGSEAGLDEQDGVRVIRRARNGGKGAAVLEALALAASAGFTHALVMDADGQHPADAIAPFFAASRERPEAMILGVPQFGPDAPALRVRGRRISNWWARLETGGAIGDSLFGFRVYPIAPLLRIMRRSGWMRRFDFDPEAAVRLSWAGVPAVNLPAPVRYLRPEEGGVSHFRYGRDNVLLTAMHVRLVIGAMLRAPRGAWRRLLG
jgi:glycosyltransferase involved in cell wall biosynthesis